MLSRAAISAYLGSCLVEAHFPQWHEQYRQGKVRDMYLLPAGDGHPARRIIITTDRVSAFDRVLGAIPLKGQVLSELAVRMFDATAHICPNALITVPHPNVQIVEELGMVLIEIVVRGFLTGSTSTSVLTHYQAGERDMYGYAWPDGLKDHQSLADVFGGPIITPTTKSAGHDQPLSLREVVEKGLADEATWAEMQRIALALFARGQKRAEERGLILVDTKYEMGRTASGAIALADEVHTPDSSRYWIAATYEERIAREEPPENLDKEFLRLWLKEQGITGDTPVIPPLPYTIRVDVAERYIRLYELVTGKEFEPQDAGVAVLAAIEEAIAPYFS